MEYLFSIKFHKPIERACHVPKFAFLWNSPTPASRIEPFAEEIRLKIGRDLNKRVNGNGVIPVFIHSPTRRVVGTQHKFIYQPPY